MEVSGQDRAQATLTPRKYSGVHRLGYGSWGGGGGKSGLGVLEGKKSPPLPELGEK